MRKTHLLLMLLLALGLVAQGCTPRGGGRGGGGGGGDDDDDSAGDDDDSQGDDDDSQGDDDDSQGDDDDSQGGPQETSNAAGTYTLEFDFSGDVENVIGWNSCQRVVTLTQVSGDIESGCPGCDFVMRLDSSNVTTNCDPATGITDDPMTGIQFGVEAGDGDLRFWNYGDSVWGTLIEGGSSSSSNYNGDTGWQANDFTWEDGNAYDYESRASVNLSWN